MSTSNDSLIAQLVSAASTAPSRTQWGQSSQLRSGDSVDYASHLASTASRYASQFSGTPSHRVSKFASDLRSGSSLGRILGIEHSHMLSVGAAPQVVSELASRGQWRKLDYLHAHMNSVVDSDPSPVSYDSNVSDPPPAYSSAVGSGVINTDTAVSTRDTEPEGLIYSIRSTSPSTSPEALIYTTRDTTPSTSPTRRGVSWADEIPNTYGSAGSIYKLDTNASSAAPQSSASPVSEVGTTDRSTIPPTTDPPVSELPGSTVERSELYGSTPLTSGTGRSELYGSTVPTRSELAGSAPLTSEFTGCAPSRRGVTFASSAKSGSSRPRRNLWRRMRKALHRSKPSTDSNSSISRRARVYSRKTGTDRTDAESALRAAHLADVLSSMNPKTLEKLSRIQRRAARGPTYTGMSEFAIYGNRGPFTSGARGLRDLSTMMASDSSGKRSSQLTGGELLGLFHDLGRVQRVWKRRR